MIVVNMTRAKEIQRQKMRERRAGLLAALDVEMQITTEKGDSTAVKALADRKQALRDVTKDAAIDVAKTPEELKKVWPKILGQK